MQPPIAKPIPHVSTWHGHTLTDPYHWLRDPGYPDVSDERVLEYLHAENAYFEHHFGPLRPLVNELFEEMKGRQPEELTSVPYTYGGYRYQWRYAREAQYREWFRAPLDAPDAWQLMLSEPQLAESHPFFRLGGIVASPSNALLAYTTDTSGDERFTLEVRALGDQPAPDMRVENVLGAPVWSPNSDALYYVALNEQWRPFQVRRRTLDGRDELLFEEQDDAFFVGIDESQSEQFLIVSTGDHITNEVHILDLHQPQRGLELITPRRPGHEYHVDHRADGLYLLTNRRHANFDLVRTTPDAPAEANWEIVLEGSDDLYLTGHLCLKDYLVVEQRRHGQDQIRVLAADGSEHVVAFPDPLYSVSLGANPNADASVLRLHYESLVRPEVVYDYDLASRNFDELRVQEIPGGYDPSRYESRRVFAPARDGERVPVSLVWHRDHPPSNTSPLYLYGYGAYGMAMTPSFSTSRLSLLDRGWVYAIAHIRGGDEMGYRWYEAGKGLHRTNTFNDFVDAARHLIDEGATSAGRIAIAGGSAGGELMGAVVNQAPELWRAVAAHVPFVDVLNTMLDGSLPLTPIEWPEWGNPIESAEAFTNIQSYSPYDQLVAGHYPAMLVTAGLHDPRVTYWEPAKYVAKLRTLKQDERVLLLKTNMEAGHGGRSGRYESLRELAEEYAFFLSEMEGPASP